MLPRSSRPRRVASGTIGGLALGSGATVFVIWLRRSFQCPRRPSTPPTPLPPPQIPVRHCNRPIDQLESQLEGGIGGEAKKSNGNRTDLGDSKDFARDLGGRGFEQRIGVKKVGVFESRWRDEERGCEWTILPFYWIFYLLGPAHLFSILSPDLTLIPL